VVVHRLAPATVGHLIAENRTPVSAGIRLRDHELLETLSDNATGLAPERWRDLPRLLETATPYLDPASGNLIYALNASGRSSKIAVRIADGYIRSAGAVSPRTLRGYTELRK